MKSDLPIPKIDEEIEDETKIKILIKAGESFTPYQIKNLSKPGKINMGYYGVCAYIFISLTTLINLYELINSNTEPIVIINLMIPTVISLLSLFRGIASIFHFLFKQFK
jgi:hypothetical protein